MFTLITILLLFVDMEAIRLLFSNDAPNLFAKGHTDIAISEFPCHNFAEYRHELQVKNSHADIRGVVEVSQTCCWCCRDKRPHARQTCLGLWWGERTLVGQSSRRHVRGWASSTDHLYMRTAVVRKKFIKKPKIRIARLENNKKLSIHTHQASPH
jgi:hypothetical protein